MNERAAQTTHRLTLTDHPTPAMRSAILCPLIQYNEEQAGPENHRPLAILVSNPATNDIVGGLWASTSNSFLHVDLLFLPEELRRVGLGRRLMQDAEEEARRRGCCGVWLDTYSFQAREFYERLGYSVFGTLNNYPPGHSRFFLTKSLRNVDTNTPHDASDGLGGSKTTDPFPEFSRVRLRQDVTQEGRRRLDNGVWEDFSETMPAGSWGTVVHIYDDGAAYEVEFFDAGQTIGCFTVPHDDLERVNDAEH